MIGGNVDEHLDLYFRQCSLLVNTADLAIIGATLANGGLNPVTGERALAAEHVRAVLSVMNTCGMYDYAGGWQFDVGLPAKSGVGGGITAVLPGHLGIGVFSPRLDAVGNSERGVKVCEDISRNFRLHLFEDRGSGPDPVRRFYRGTDVRSSRMRRQAEIEALDQDGHAIAVCELQGELSFVEAERVSRRIGEERSSFSYLILDMTRLRRVDAVAMQLLEMLAGMLTEGGQAFAVASLDARPARHERRRRLSLGRCGARGVRGPAAGQGARGRRGRRRRRRARGSSRCCATGPTSAVEALAAHLKPRPIAPGEVLIEAGSPGALALFPDRGPGERVRSTSRAA